MSISGGTLLIIDQRPDYLSGSRHSLLTQPVGSSNLLNYVLERCAGCLRDCCLHVVPLFEFSADYVDAVRACAPCVAVRGTGDLHDLLMELEPSDRIIVLDPSHLPEEGLHLERLATATREKGAVHLVPLAGNSAMAHERVQLDGAERVRRIQRYYSGITDVKASGVIASSLCVSLLRAADDLSKITPSEMRSRLMLAGIPSRDITLDCRAYDLTNEGELIRFNQHVMRDQDVNSAERERQPAGVIAHERSQVDSTARLYPPVFLAEGSQIGPRAVIVGPVVIGRGASIGKGAVVANAIVHENVMIAESAALCDAIATRAIASSLMVEGAARPLIDASPIGHASKGSAPGTRGRIGRRDSVQRWAKRFIDVVLSSIGLLILSPLLLIAAILVKATSRGPVLFGHVREGRDGREFRCWKFRTMVQNAHALQRELYKSNHVDGPQFKLAADPRVTRIGRFLRTTNIDELPQLVNVLLGQMSLIGPRPSPFRENQICVPWRNARLSVRPGITGLWQVCRHDRDAGDFHQWIHYDMMYVRHWSLLLDLRILLATVLTLGGRFSVPVHWLVTDGGAASGDLLDFAAAGDTTLLNGMRNATEPSISLRREMDDEGPREACGRSRPTESGHLDESRDVESIPTRFAQA